MRPAFGTVLGAAFAAGVAVAALAVGAAAVDGVGGPVARSEEGHTVS